MSIQTIRDTLKHFADKATSNGDEYEYDGWADANGHLTEAPQSENGYRVMCWWDTADPNNPGYAMRIVQFDDGENVDEESDAL